jgi:hypothetical protein
MIKIMKKILLFSIVLMISGFSLLAQAPPVPPGSANEGGQGPVGGGGAPIGGGIVLLIALAAGYGGKKVYDYKMRKLAEQNNTNSKTISISQQFLVFFVS